MSSLNKLKKWILKYKFLIKIIKTSIEEVNFNTKIININKDTKISSQIITLLHECGHILIYMQRKKYKYKYIVGSTWKDWHNLFINRTKKTKILILEEEIEAWNRGKKLAKRLKIKIQTKLWNYHKTRALMTYIR
jgi:hypothetical protein